MSDLFRTTSATDRGRIDRAIGKGNGMFLGHVANGMTRAELERRYRAGEFPDLNPMIAAHALKEAGR